MPVARRRRDRLSTGQVLSRRDDHSRLAVVVRVKDGVAEVMTPDGRTRGVSAPYGYLPRYSPYLRHTEVLAEPLLEHLRVLCAARRRTAEQLARRPTLTRYEAASAAQMRVQGIDWHRINGAFEWAKRGREVVIDRASFERWLAQRQKEEQDGSEI